METAEKDIKRQMCSSSKDLLHFEHINSSSASPLQSSLLVCKEDFPSQTKRAPPDGKPVTGPVARSQVLGKVKDFLGVISEANKRLQQDAKENSENYDIEMLNGNESEVIEMDLMLGIADLHTPEAVAAAESVIAGSQPFIPLAASSSESDTEDTDEDEESDDEDSNDDRNNKVDDDDEGDNKKSYLSAKIRKSSFGNGNSSEAVGKNKSKKKPKIVEMP